MTKFEPKSLFDRVDARRDLANSPYPTDLAELDAARTGAKPMSCYSAYCDDFTKRGVARAVFGRSLAMALWPVHHRPGTSHGVTAFVARPAELWRVPAKLLDWGTPKPGYWDASDDAYGSRLFGYTPAQIRRWQAHLHAHDTFCMYTLLTRAQRKRVVALGKRCFGSAADIEQLALHYTRAPLKRDGFARVPRGLVLARTRLNHLLLRDLLGDWQKNRPKPFVSIRPTFEQASAIVAHVHANVEFLTARGWR